MKVSDCRLLNLPKYVDRRGNLCFIEESWQVPFKIKRTYWIYDVPVGVERGGHACRKNVEFIVALSGCFDVVIDDGVDRQIFHLDCSCMGLLVPNGLWRVMNNFSTNSLALILADSDYDETDYIRKYKDYKRWTLLKK